MSACASSNPSPNSQPPAINFATEWLDELGRVCPKNVDLVTTRRSARKATPSRPLTAAASRRRSSRATPTSFAACATDRRSGGMRAAG